MQQHPISLVDDKNKKNKIKKFFLKKKRKVCLKV